MKGETKNKYVFIWSNIQSFTTIEADENALLNYRENPWNCLSDLIHVRKGMKIFCYVSDSDLVRNYELGKSYFDDKFASAYFDGVEKACEKHGKMFEKFRSTNFSKLSNEELYLYAAEAVDRFSETIGYFRGSQMEPTRALTEKISESVTPEEAQILLLPGEIDATGYEQIAWQEIISEPYDEKRMLAHADKFPWLLSAHFTYDDVLNTLRARYDFDKRNLIKKDIRAEREHLRQKQGEILKNKDGKIKKYIHLLNKISLTRIALKSCWAGNDYYSIPVYLEIAKRTGEPLHEIMEYYSIPEVGVLLKEGRKIDSQEKKQRHYCFTSIYRNGKITTAVGEEGEKLAKQELGDILNTEGITELKGVSANPGMVRGVARILPANDVEKTRSFRLNFKSGEILVTEMTQPNIMDIAKKAGAIVTDEGGMLSHAAIISREFKIPCVVGTHKATLVLKDGDTVEVDANKGIVKILK